MATEVFLKCNKCKLPLTARGKLGDRVKLTCANGHVKTYSSRYVRRFQQAADYKGDLPSECPACKRPIREKSRTFQDAAKPLGRIECVCGYALYYDANTHTWVPDDD